MGPWEACGGSRSAGEPRRQRGPSTCSIRGLQDLPGPKNAILGQILDFLETSPPAPSRNRGCGMSTTGLQIQKSGTKIDRPTFCVIFFVCTVQLTRDKIAEIYPKL